jgi:hypothetical protein
LIRFTLIHAIFLLSTQFWADWLSNRDVKSFVTEMVLAKFVFFSDLKIKTDFVFSDSSLEILCRFWSESGKKQTWKWIIEFAEKLFRLLDFHVKCVEPVHVQLFLGLSEFWRFLNTFISKKIYSNATSSLIYVSKMFQTSPRPGYIK